MATCERNGIHLEQCDKSRGIFLDFGELESLTQMESRFAPAAPPQQQGYGQQSGYGYGPEGVTAAASTIASRASAGCFFRASVVNR